MFFSSIEEINGLLKERSWLLSKGMSSIYLKVSIEKKWHTGNVDVWSLKNSSPGQFWRALSHADVIEFSNFLLHLKNQRSGGKLCVALLLLLFWKEFWRFKVKESMLLFEKNVNCNKNETIENENSQTQF